MTPAPFRVDPARSVPIWTQIEDGIRRLVATGELGPRDAVPSVRDLASRLRVNPATVARAYQLLAEEGLLEVRRGEGTFVAAAPVALARGERERRLREAAEQFHVTALTLSASLEEATDSLAAVWSGVRARAGRGSR